MELIFPIMSSIGAISLLIIGLVFRWIYQIDEIEIICLLLSTILFFVAGATFLGVTYVDPTTGALITTTVYNPLVWLMIPFGMIPILLMFEGAFSKQDEG